MGLFAGGCLLAQEKNVAFWEPEDPREDTGLAALDSFSAPSDEQQLMATHSPWRCPSQSTSVIQTLLTSLSSVFFMLFLGKCGGFLF